MQRIRVQKRKTRSRQAETLIAAPACAVEGHSARARSILVALHDLAEDIDRALEDAR